MVISTTDVSVPCSASISRSAASRTGSAVPSAITTLSVGPSSIIVVTPWRCISTWAMVTAGEPGPTTLRTVGIDSRAEPERGDAGRAVDAEHVAQAELAAHDEHGRVDLAAAARDRRHDERRCCGTPATIAGTASWYVTLG